MRNFISSPSPRHNIQNFFKEDSLEAAKLISPTLPDKVTNIEFYLLIVKNMSLIPYLDVEKIPRIIITSLAEKDYLPDEYRNLLLEEIDRIRRNRLGT